MNPKPPQAHTVPNVRFLCEQKGPSEALLTTKLSEIFAAGGLVERAYLVRVAFGNDPAAMNVVLAIRTRSGGEERELLSTVGDAFASLLVRTSTSTFYLSGTIRRRPSEMSVRPSIRRLRRWTGYTEATLFAVAPRHWCNSRTPLRSSRPPGLNKCTDEIRGIAGLGVLRRGGLGTCLRGHRHRQPRAPCSSQGVDPEALLAECRRDASRLAAQVPTRGT
jgi:hypothetical protein